MSFLYSVWWNGKYARSTSTLQSIAVVLKKGTCTVVWIWTELVCFSWNSILLERMTDRQMMVIHTLVFGRHFLKANKVSLLFQGKQLTVFVANDKILFFKRKLKFWKTYVCHHDCGSFSIIKYFSGEINGDINKCDFFFISYKKYVNIWNICITQWTNIFQMTNTWCYKIMCA